MMPENVRNDTDQNMRFGQLELLAMPGSAWAEVFDAKSLTIDRLLGIGFVLLLVLYFSSFDAESGCIDNFFSKSFRIQLIC